MNRKWLIAPLSLLLAVPFMGAAVRNSESFMDAALGWPLDSNRKPLAFRLRDQFRHDLKKSIESNQKAARLEEWRTSPSHISVLFQTLRDFETHHRRRLKKHQLPSSPSPAAHAFCQALEELQDAHLALLDSEIIQPQNLTKLPCAPTLKSQLYSYWLNQQEAFASPSHRPSGRVREQKTLFVDPTLESEVNVSLLQAGQYGLLIEMGEHEKRTRQLHHLLAQRGLKANYFVTGKWAQTKHSLIRELHRLGNEVGFSSWNQQNLHQMDLGRAEWFLTRSHQSLKKYRSSEPRFFHFSKMLHPAHFQSHLRKLHALFFHPSVDSGDWKTPDVKSWVETVLAKVTTDQRAIIRISDAQPVTRLGLSHLLSRLEKSGFQPVLIRAKERSTQLSFRDR